MNIRQYVYEFVGALIFYSIAGLILGFETNIIIIIAGIIGSYLGYVISKINGFFFEKIINYNHTPVLTGTGDSFVHFDILAKYKGSQISIRASYTAKNIVDIETLSALLWTKINSTHYKKLNEQDFFTIDIKLKNETIELLLIS